MNSAGFALFSLFGSEAGFENVEEVFITISLVLFLFSILGNLVILWSIPSWKIMITLREVTNCSRMRWDFRLTTWFAVVCFLAGLVTGFIGNIPI